MPFPGCARRSVYPRRMSEAARILVLGGGYIGLYCAMGLEKRLPNASITLVSPESYMTYQSFLPEAASGNIEPRHVVVPLRRVLKQTRVLTGKVTGIDTQRKLAAVHTIDGGDVAVPYDVLVTGVGSVSRVLYIP